MYHGLIFFRKPLMSQFEQREMVICEKNDVFLCLYTTDYSIVHYIIGHQKNDLQRDLLNKLVIFREFKENLILSTSSFSKPVSHLFFGSQL